MNDRPQAVKDFMMNLARFQQVDRYPAEIEQATLFCSEAHELIRLVDMADIIVKPSYIHPAWGPITAIRTNVVCNVFTKVGQACSVK